MEEMKKIQDEFERDIATLKMEIMKSLIPVIKETIENIMNLDKIELIRDDNDNPRK